MLNLVDVNLPEFVSRYLTPKNQELGSYLLLASSDFLLFFFFSFSMSCVKAFLRVAGV